MFLHMLVRDSENTGIFKSLSQGNFVFLMSSISNTIPSK